MISTTGRSPVTAMPSATPTKAFWQIGVVDDAARKGLGQALVRLEDAAGRPDVLAHEVDRRVRRHLVEDRGVDGVAVGHLGDLGLSELGTLPPRTGPFRP